VLSFSAGSGVRLKSGSSARLRAVAQWRQELSGIVAEHIVAVNAFDIDAIVATFAKDAYVNDNRREIVGIEAIHHFQSTVTVLSRSRHQLE
jgi:hypothetical protein